MKRHHVALLIITLAGCGGGNPPADTGPADTGVMDSSMSDTSMPPVDSGMMDTGLVDSGTPTPRSTTFVTSSGGGEMTGAGYQLRLTIGITPAGNATGPGNDLSLGANSVLR